MIDLKEGINNSFGFMRLRRALRGGPERTMIEREAIEVEAGEKAALREIVAEIDRELGAIPNQEKIRENLELLEENGPLGRWLNGIIRPYAEEQLAFWERHRK